MSKLKELIEQLREKMNQLAKEKGINHPEVLTISQQLDELLNQYNNETKT